MMQITCSKCQKVYDVDQSKIPPGITSTKCKACGTSISLRPGAPQAPAPPKADGMQITCVYCSKTYSINAAKIPPGVTSTKCKACGHTISLKAAPVVSSALKTEIDKKASRLQQQP